MSPDLIPTSEVAVMCGVTRQAVSQWVADGRLTPVLKGAPPNGPMWFERADVERLAVARAAS